MTESAIEVSNLAIQVHGGIGVIEEAGVAQLMRDCRVFAIYEGTNGIQALDLVGRKTLRDQGQAAFELLDDLAADVQAARAHLPPTLTAPLDQAMGHMRTQIHALLSTPETAPVRAGAYLSALCLLTVGVCMLRRAHHRNNLKDPEAAQAQLEMATFYMHALMPRCVAALETMQRAPQSLNGLNHTRI